MAGKKKKLMSVMLSACMVMSAVPAVNAAGTGSDISGHWAQNSMQEFIDAGYIKGDDSGSYLPNGSMTRAQYAAILNRIMGFSEESADISKYTDISASSWYYADLAKAIAAGYMSGTSGSTMSPDEVVTREQAFTMMARILGLDMSDTSELSRFADADKISSWARGAINAMVKAGYITGDNNGNINPVNNLTRAEGVTALNRGLTELKKASGNAEAKPEAGNLKDGVYTGTGAGYGGTIKMQVTVSGGKITAIDILSHSETGSYLTRAKAVIDKIIAAGTTEGVSAVSGATKSCNGIFTAVNACISQASGGEDTSKTGSTGGGGGGGAGTAGKVEGEDYLGALKDGVYNGTATGFRAGFNVTVTVSGGKITKIDVNSNDDASYLNSATSKMIPEIIAKQSTEVDTVSGATYSSNGLINAVKDALKEAIPVTAKTYQVSNWQEFIAAAAKAIDGDTIELAANITDAGKTVNSEKNIDAFSSPTLTVNKKITIDGKNHTITASTDKVTSITTDKTGAEIKAEGIDATFCFLIEEAQGIEIKDLVIDGASFSAKLGGAMYAESGVEATLTNVTFKNCHAKNAGAGNGGGAIYAEPHHGTSPTVTCKNCTFENNLVGAEGKTGRGGAVAAYNANIILDGCTFSGNKAAHGGAVAAAGASELTVKNCTFEASNDAEYGGDDIYVFDGYTFYKKTMGTDSKVSYSITGNTHKSTDPSGGSDDYKGYRVVLGSLTGRITDTLNISGNTNIVECTGTGSDTFLPGKKLVYSNTDYNRTAAPESSSVSEYKVLMMDIPYADFYANEDLGSNSVTVDAVSSATDGKWKANGTGERQHAAGSYNNSATSPAKNEQKILGVRFPVLITEEDLGQLGTSVDEGNNYHYTESAAGTFPDVYKILTIDAGGNKSFSAVQGSVETLSGAAVTLNEFSAWGDFQIDLSKVTIPGTVAGVIVNTVGSNANDKKGYALRHLENIWKTTELSWSCGAKTTEPHGNTLSSAHYASMMGRYITGVTYITSEGIYDIPFDSKIYIGKKTAGASILVANAAAESKTTALTKTGLDAKFSKYRIAVKKGETDVTKTFSFKLNADATTVTWAEDASKNLPEAGTYTLTLYDAANVFAPLQASFEIQTADMPVKYDAAALGLVKADDTADKTFTAADSENYIANIKSVSVKKSGDTDPATSYAASGKGSTKIIGSDGRIDFSAASGGTPVFIDKTAGTQYEITVQSAGYSTDFTFTAAMPAAMQNVSLTMSAADGKLIIAAEGVSDAAALGNPAVTITSGGGKNMVTVFSGSVDSLEVSGLKLTEGTEYTVKIICSSYQAYTGTVTCAQ